MQYMLCVLYRTGFCESAAQTKRERERERESTYTIIPHCMYGLVWALIKVNDKLITRFPLQEIDIDHSERG